MRYFQKLLCLLILGLAASFGVGGCVLLYSDFSVQRSRMAAANAAAHAQACTLLQTEILDLQRRGTSTGDAALTARVTAQDVPAALWRGDTLVCATLEGLQSFPLGDAATVTVRTENSIYAVYASDLQGGLRLVTAYDLTGLYRDVRRHGAAGPPPDPPAGRPDRRRGTDRSRGLRPPHRPAHRR